LLKRKEKEEGVTLFAPFIYKSDRFTKTGSGQTYGKHSKKIVPDQRFDLVQGRKALAERTACIK
jgi:hypothetical protein